MDRPTRSRDELEIEVELRFAASFLLIVPLPLFLVLSLCPSPKDLASMDTITRDSPPSSTLIHRSAAHSPIPGGQEHEHKSLMVSNRICRGCPNYTFSGWLHETRGRSVGLPGKRQAVVNLRNTVFAFKRLIGRSLTLPSRMTWLTGWLARITRSPSDINTGFIQAFQCC